jgi:hypothetical protein
MQEVLEMQETPESQLCAESSGGVTLPRDHEEPLNVNTIGRRSPDSSV